MKFILGALLLTLINCSSGQKAPTSKEAKPDQPSKPVEMSSLSNLTPITQIGENAMGRFSPDSSKIVYQSRLRSGHKSAQIYILNLTNQKEKRVTYNDGDDFFPSFDSTGKNIIYSSTTDEIKEHPETPTPERLKSFDPFEILDQRANFEDIYLSEADGSHIRRLTNTVGFDGQSQVSTDGRKIVFISQRQGAFEIFTMDIRGHNLNRVIKSENVIASPSLSPDGKRIVYEVRPAGTNIVQIKITDLRGKNIIDVTPAQNINRDPSWSPDGKKIIFSSNRENEKSFLIYEQTLDNTCLKRITPASSDKSTIFVDVFPELSQDGKKLLFTSQRSGTYQLYLVNFEEPADCLKDKP